MRNPFVCGGCGRRFRSLDGFDAHRRPANTDTCANPAALVDKHGRARFAQNALGEWQRVRADKFPTDGRLARPARGHAP